MNTLTREEWLSDTKTGRMVNHGLTGAAIVFALAAALALVALIVLEWPRPKPVIVAMEPPPVVCPTTLPPPAKASKPIKSAPKVIATQAIIMPASAIKNHEISPITPAEQDFANRLQNFERKIP